MSSEGLERFKVDPDSSYGQQTETIGIPRGPCGRKNILTARLKSAQQNENALEDGKLLKVTTHIETRKMVR